MKKRANNLDRIIDFESEEKLAAEVKDVKPFHADSDDINDYDNDDDDLDVSNDRKVQQAKERLQKLQREKEEKERIEKEKKEKELQEKLEKEKQQKQKEQEEKELRLKQEKENKEKQEQENQEKERKEKERKEKEHREQESKQRERIEKEKKEKELQEKLEKEKQQKQKEQEEEKEKELRLKQEKENKENQEKETKEKEQKEKQNYSYSHNGNNHNNHKGGYGQQDDDNNHKGGYGQQDDDDDNHKGGYGNQGDDDNNHKGGYGHHDDDGYGHKGGYGHQDDDDGYGHKGHKGGYGHHDDDDDGYKGHKGGYGHHDDDDDGYKGHKGGYGHHDDDDGYGHHGKKCNSNLDCTHLTSSLCSKGVCVGGYCQKSSTNVTHLECCRDEDCNKRTDWNLDKRINSRDYPELEECNAGKCQGGVFNDKGELITSPTCSRRENCCINKEWDNYCNWPGGQATWTREACKGENCQVSTWGAIYSYPIPRHTPNFPDIVPRFLFKKNWISLYKKLIIVALNVENQFNIKKIFIQRSQSTLVSKLNEIEDFLKSACSIWSKLDPQCSIPDGITPFPFIGLLDFTNSPKFSQYDHFLDSILSGNYSGLPFCSHNHHY